MLENPFYHHEDMKPQPQSRFWRWTLIGWLFVIGLIGAGIAQCARAAPHAESMEECALLADMAIVARALALDKMERKQADRIMRRIYVVAGKGELLMRLITDAAYREEGGAAGEFSVKLLRQCGGSRGNLDPILGSDI